MKWWRKWSKQGAPIKGSFSKTYTYTYWKGHWQGQNNYEKKVLLKYGKAMIDDTAEITSVFWNSSDA